jgi:CubicO group peptidase (beta-lactamase class C family)
MSRLLKALATGAALGLLALSATAQIPRPHDRPAQALEKPLAKVPPWTLPSDAKIRATLADLVDRRHVAPGFVIGIIEPSGRRIIAYGKRDADDPRPLDGQTLFEMGSITKLFTALLLTDMAGRGEVKLSDPAVRLAPPGMSLPVRAGREITLLDLVTHTSGLPDFPANLGHKTALNPFADYSEAKLESFLAAYHLPRVPGAAWDYSSLGVGLLGDLLARRENTDYESLVRARILAPLGMRDTGVTLTAAQRARLTPGHTPAWTRAPNWDLPVLEGCAGLKSDADDMLSFLAANLGYDHTALDPALASMLSVKRPTDWPSDRQAIGWIVSQTSMGEVVHHEGETAGYRTYVAFDPVRKTGIVLLANAHTQVDLGDVGDLILIGTRRS